MLSCHKCDGGGRAHGSVVSALQPGYFGVIRLHANATHSQLPDKSGASRTLALVDSLVDSFQESHREFSEHEENEQPKETTGLFSNTPNSSFCGGLWI